MNAMENKNSGASREAGNNQTQTASGRSRRFFVPAGAGMCVLTLHLRPELIGDNMPSVHQILGEGGESATEGGTPSKGETDTNPTGKRQRRKTTQKLFRVLLSDGKPVDGREATGSLRVVYLPKGEVYNPKKHGNGCRYNRFWHKPMKSVPLTEEVA